MARRAARRTTLTEDEIGEYSGAKKEIRPVTIATYQVMTDASGRASTPHLELFDARDWGLIIYDEVHLLPAPVFRFTADIQARRRLGLTATLVREDGREGDVFSPHRPQALRRAVEGHRGAGLHRAGRLHRGAGHAARRASGWPTPPPSRRSATGCASTAPAKIAVVEAAGRAASPASRCW